MAIELKRPVVVGAQINKSNISSSVLDSIRESADIGHEAVLVLALKRDKAPKSGSTFTNLTVEVAKNRYGPNGTIFKLKVNNPTFRISLQNEQSSASTAEKSSAPTLWDVEPGGVWSRFVGEETTDLFAAWTGTEL